MTELIIPYQNHNNKAVFDYMLNCSNQLNNVNGATSLESEEAKSDNHAYLVFINGSVYLLVMLSSKNNDSNSYKHQTDIWAKLYDVDTGVSDYAIAYSFNIKKFYSVLSFSSDYKNRSEITFYATESFDKIFYLISDTIAVDLAVKTQDSAIVDHIKESYLRFATVREYKFTTDSQDATLLVEPVDKNSFLLPYANHKDCLDFAIADKNIISELSIVDDQLYFDCKKLSKNNEVMFHSHVLLRKDKFNYFGEFFINTLPISTGVWQLLVMLQSIKAWQKLQISIKHNFAILNLRSDVEIYSLFSSPNTNNYNNIINTNSKTYLAGELYASEIFLLNKLFSNPKTSYFDFSNQTFTGNSYIFNDSKDTFKSVDFTVKHENELPLKISFTELKHYIGGDLSQKNFILRVYFDGINVILERWNSEDTLLEYRILFNHTMSKKHLNI